MSVLDRSRAEQSKNGTDHVISLTITNLTAIKSNGVTKFGNTGDNTILPISLPHLTPHPPCRDVF